jgi:hypothetical protein
MPETAVVRANGGEVKILPLKPGYSNSTQYAKIVRAMEQEGEFKRPEWLQNAQLPK